MKPFMELIHVWHGDSNWSKIWSDIIPIQVHDLVLQFLFFFFFFFFWQSLQWISFMFCMTIEPYLKFYAVPSPSQYMTLRSRPHTLSFMLMFFNFSFCKALWWLWFMFGMNEHKILKCFSKEKHDFWQVLLSGEDNFRTITAIFGVSEYLGIYGSLRIIRGTAKTFVDSLSNLQTIWRNSVKFTRITLWCFRNEYVKKCQNS